MKEGSRERETGLDSWRDSGKEKRHPRQKLPRQLDRRLPDVRRAYASTMRALRWTESNELFSPKFSSLSKTLLGLAG